MPAIRKDFLSYNLFIKGVFGRNRSVKTDVLTLSETVAPLDIDTVKKLALDKLQSLKVKGSLQFGVSYGPEWTEEEDGHIVRGLTIGGGTRLFAGTFAAGSMVVSEAK